MEITPKTTFSGKQASFEFYGNSLGSIVAGKVEMARTCLGMCVGTGNIAFCSIQCVFVCLNKKARETVYIQFEIPFHLTFLHVSESSKSM